MGETHENTNLASEFYVISTLHRLGKNALLTLGNKKSVDIVIEEGEDTVTIDVKGLRGNSSFPVDNCDKKQKNHFIIFVAYCNNIGDPTIQPEVYVFPSVDFDKKFSELDDKSIVYISPKDSYKRVQLGSLRKLKNRYQDKWELLDIK